MLYEMGALQHATILAEFNFWSQCPTAYYSILTILLTIPFVCYIRLKHRGNERLQREGKLYEAAIVYINKRLFNLL